MKISIDLDGTLWDHMEFFRELMKSMQAAGHRVGILTGHAHDTKERDVDLMLARGFPRPDFYFGRTSTYMPFNGAKFKSSVILKYGIDVHFDDLDYGNSETAHLFQEIPGVWEKVVTVRWREPKEVHYE